MKLWQVHYRINDRKGSIPIIAEFMSVAILKALILLPGNAQIKGAMPV